MFKGNLTVKVVSHSRLQLKRLNFNGSVSTGVATVSCWTRDGFYPKRMRAFPLDIGMILN